MSAADPRAEKKRVTLYRNAFPDIRFTVEDLIAEGETVVARWSCRGTHKGELNGIAPTNKQFHITGVSIARFTNGKMFEGYVNWDAWASCSSSASSPNSAAPRPSPLPQGSCPDLLKKTGRSDHKSGLLSFW